MRQLSRAATSRLSSLVALALAACVVSPAGKADHWACSGRATIPTLRFPPPQFFDLAGHNVGDVIAEMTLDTQAVNAQCTRAVDVRTADGEGLIATASYAVPSATPVAGMPGVFATPGSPVGFRVTISLPGAGAATVPASGRFTFPFVEREGAVPMTPNGTLLRIEALKVGTGPLPSGGVSAHSVSLEFDSNYLRELPGTGYVPAGSNLGRMNSIGYYRFVPEVVPTCTLLQSDMSVDLGIVNASSLANANDVTPPVVRPLRVQCAGGTGSQTVAASAHFTDATDPSNTSTQLSLAAGSTASGVAVRFLKDGITPIVFGPESSWQSGWKLGDWANGEPSIPLGFQMIRTSGALRGGSVRAMATYIMTYE